MGLCCSSCVLWRGEAGLHPRAFTCSNDRLMFEEYNKVVFCTLSRAAGVKLRVNQVSVRHLLNLAHTSGKMLLPAFYLAQGSWLFVARVTRQAC